MAKTRVGGKNGAVTYSGSMLGFGADFSAFSMRISNPTDDDTSYADTGVGSSHAGSGTYDYALSANGFLAKGASGFAPNLASSTFSGTVTTTSDTGCSHSGIYVVSNVSINHAKRAGAIPISVEAINDGDIAETWSVS